MRVRCACGWEMAGDEGSVVVGTKEHGRRLHNMEATREQIVAMAIDETGDATDSASAGPGRPAVESG